MKTVIYECDFCGRKIEREIAIIEGDRGREHYGHGFKFHLCRYCYPKIFNLMQRRLTEERQKHYLSMYVSGEK